MSVSHTHGYVICSSQPQQVLSAHPQINLLPDLSKDLLEMLWMSVARSDLEVLTAGIHDTTCRISLLPYPWQATAPYFSGFVLFLQLLSDFHELGQLLVA